MYLCKVCVMRGGRGGGVNVGRCQILTSLNPLVERGRSTNNEQPIMNNQETIPIVQKFNTRGLAITTDKTNLPLL